MSSNINKKRITIAFLVLLIGPCGVGVYLTLSNTSEESQPSEIPAKAAKKASEGTVKDPVPADYYCVDRHSVYYNQKKKFKGDIEKLRDYFIKNHKLKYDLGWYRKNDGWHLNTSKWTFSVKGKEQKKIKWARSACRVSRSKKQISCPIVLYKGILWKLKFLRFQGGFIKIELYRVPLSKEAKQKKQMAEFFGVKEVNDVDICLRVGPSPFDEIALTKPKPPVSSSDKK